MFETRFGLRRRPFRPIPDTDSYFPAATHEDALRQLRRGIDDDEGIMLLTGDPGTGKTMVARKLLESLDEAVRPVLLTNSHVSRNGDLLQAILFDLGLPYQGVTEQVARLTVTDSCLEYYREGGKTLIVIDEAQHLHPDVLEELRLLSNLEGNSGKAIQILLVALPAIERAIDMPSLAAFRQRLTVRTRLDLLDASESAEYLIHQVRARRTARMDLRRGRARHSDPRGQWQSANPEPGSPCRLFARGRSGAWTGRCRGGGRGRHATRTRPSGGRGDIADGRGPGSADAGSAHADCGSAGSDFAAAAGTANIPFEPVILPIEDGPPTYLYGDEILGESDAKATARGPSDRVG